MALTTSEFLMQYSNGIAKTKRDAINNALGEHIGTRDDKLLVGSNLYLLIHKNYWKYGKNGVLQKVPDGENDWEKQEDDCPWLESPESLKAALNGGMVRDYKKALTKSLKETGNMPEVGTTMDNLMRTDSIMIEAQRPAVGGN